MAQRQKIRGCTRILMVSLSPAILVLAAMGLPELPYYAYSLIWTIDGIDDRPPASALLRLEIENKTQHDLVGCVSLLNDEFNEENSPWHERQSQRLGWVKQRTGPLPANRSELFEFPIEGDIREVVAVICCYQKAQIDKHVSLSLFRWPTKDGEFAWRDDSGEWPVWKIPIDVEDMMPNSVLPTSDRATCTELVDGVKCYPEVVEIQGRATD